MIINGQISTGPPNGNNTINSLIFNTITANSTLTVNNTLFVQSGNFDVDSGTATIIGYQGSPAINVSRGGFSKNGAGTLVVDPVTLVVGGNANINAGTLSILTTQMLVASNLNVNSGATMNVQNSSTVAVGANMNVYNGASLNVQNSSVVVVGGGVNVNGGAMYVQNRSAVAIGGGLNVNSAGAMDIDNSSIVAVAGQTGVNNGATLTVDGALASQQGVLVAQNGLLNGSGFIAGNVNNNGTVLPGDDPATLSIAGSYTQNSSGVLNIEVASSGSYGQLFVNGGASLGGTLLVTPFNGYQFVYGQYFPDFLVASSVSGTFNSVQMPFGFRGRVLYDGSFLSLVAAPESYTQVATNGNQYNVARALNSFITSSNPDKQLVSTALDIQTANQYPAAFNAIMPDFYQTVDSIGLTMATTESQLVDQRLGAIRLGATGFSYQGLGNMPVYNGKGGDGKGVADSKKNVITPEFVDNWGVWVQGNGIFGHSYSVADIPSYKFASGGFLVGADYKWDKHFSTGLFTGYQGAYADYPAGGKVWMNNSSFGLYSTYDSGIGFYANAIATGGYSNYHTNRSIQFSAINRTASSDFSRGDFAAFLESGYDLKMAGFTYGPVINAQYTYLGVAPFTESNAGSLDLKVGQQNINSLQTNIGGHIAYTWEFSEKVLIIPEARMFWNHEYLQNSTSINSSLNGGSGPTFTYNTTTPSRDSVFAGIGLNAQLGERWSAGAYYNIDFGASTSITNIVSANVGFNF